MKKPVKKYGDKIYTPVAAAKKIISKLELYGTVLDPCCGNGAFYDNFPAYVNKDFCEIDLGKDFFDYNKKVDWIVSNPPYSIFSQFLEHSFEIADNIVYLIPVQKLFTNKRIKELLDFGGVKQIMFIENKELEFPFGWATAAVYIKRGYHGPTQWGWIDSF